MQPEVEKLEPRLKEILYGCMETIRATKAALYLLDSDGSYSLLTHYGFQDSLRKSILPADPLPDRLIMRRAPFFVNGLNEEPRFSEILYAAGTDRLLAAPIYSRGRLAGFIDLRDKPGRQPFDVKDIEESQKLVEQYLDLFAKNQLYGQQSIQVAHSADKAAEIQAANIAKMVELARTVVGRQLTSESRRTPTLTEAEMASVALILPTMLMLPGAVVAAFSSFGQLSGGQMIASRAPMTQEAVDQFRGKLSGWTRKRGDSDAISRSSLQLPFGEAAAPISPERIQTVLSAPVTAGGVAGLVLSVGFERNPDAEARTLLEFFLRQIQQTVEHALSHHATKLVDQKIAEKLIEPDFQKYPHLLNHSRRVSSMADQLAHYLGLGPAECETIRIAGLVHDVGMRLLDYHAIYRKKEITDAEMLMVQEHPLVGAALVVDSGLGEEVAYIVLCHHERVDGKGYPNGLVTDQIPIGARILHICEAFDAMTASDSYQVPLPENEAIERILRGGGAQFDAQIAQKFHEMLRHAVQV
ncbi:MAG TPA: HD domain-containing phosphohydrolase [Thermoanaerobaculia bacterium]|nr:HD domain-containing phosphohydrolase [Thermoanaerobaculia bacterium]